MQRGAERDLKELPREVVGASRSDLCRIGWWQRPSKELVQHLKPGGFCRQNSFLPKGRSVLVLVRPVTD